jgi:uncharacterized membrane protein YozB (DUF420 family)
MYPFILALHNILRWVIVIFAVLALVRAYRGWLGKRPWTNQDRRAGVFLGSAMDVQLLVGLLLYVVFSPITKAALADIGAVMRDPGMRFFAVEHLFYMFLAVVLAHLGSLFAKRASEPIARHRLSAIWYTLSVLAILLGMPWMRPLLPGL